MHTHWDVVVVGSGYVGLTVSIHMANRGLAVLSVDINPQKIAALQAGVCPIFETGIDTALHRATASGKLSFATEPPAGGASAWIIAAAYIPGHPENYVQCLKQVQGIDGHPPLIAIRTTIPVGITRAMIIPALEQQFHGRMDEQFFLSLCPERTLSGAAVEELTNLPQLIGGTAASLKRTAALFGTAGIDCIALQSFEAAELAKTFTNFYRFCQFNLANFFGACCHRFGVSDELLRKALTASYPRFALNAPGPGVGGFCLPKDSLVLFDGLNFRHPISDGGTPEFMELFEYPREEYHLNERVMQYFQQSVFAAVQPARRILALGVAFKGVPPTDDTRGSVGARMVEFLQHAGKDIHVLDHCVSEEKLRSLSFTPTPRPLQLAAYDAILVLNNHPQNRSVLRDASPTNPGHTVTLYDPWRQIVHPHESILITEYRL